MAVRDDVLARLDSLIATGKRICDSYSYRPGSLSTHDDSDIPESELRSFMVSAAVVVERVAGKGGEFYRHLPEVPRRGYWLSASQDAMEAPRACWSGCVTPW